MLNPWSIPMPKPTQNPQVYPYLCRTLADKHLDQQTEDICGFCMKAILDSLHCEQQGVYIQKNDPLHYPIHPPPGLITWYALRSGSGTKYTSNSATAIEYNGLDY